jgi:hypothetical protein
MDWTKQLVLRLKTLAIGKNLNYNPPDKILQILGLTTVNHYLPKGFPIISTYFLAEKHVDFATVRK